jgi:hypothetical protein
MLSIRLRNKKEFLKDLYERHSEVSKRLIEEVLNKAIVELRNNTPIDTGAARDGWYYQFDTIESFFRRSKVKFEILNTQEYIIYVNNGTSTIAPRRFIEQVLLRYGIAIGPLAELN